MPSLAEATRKTREYPASALYLDCGPLQLGDAPVGAERIPAQMLIRSQEGVERWGEVWYHDFAGMRRNEHVAIDYRHDPDQVMGYLDTFEVKRDGLHASGFLIPVEDDELLRRIVARAKAGVPYEASIYFAGNGMRIEEVSAGAKAEVNGRKIQGPALIWREWPLRGVAICPYGGDTQTRTKLEEASSSRTSRTFTIPVSSAEEDSMSKEQTRVKRMKPFMEMEDGSPDLDEPLTKGGFLSALARAFGFGADDPPAETEGDGLGDGPAAGQDPPAKQAEEGHAAAAETAAAGDPSPGKRFLDAFGDQLGGLWYAEGLTFDEAQTRHAARLRAQNEDLKKKLSAVDRGEKEPAEFADGDEATQTRSREGQDYGPLSALAQLNAEALGKRKR